MRVVLKKTLSLVLTLLLFTAVAYSAFQIIPGDAALSILGTEATEEQLAALREQMGLNQPLPVRYWHWLTAALHGDLGVSQGYRIPVADMIREKLPITLALSVFAFLLVLIISFPLGILFSRNPGSILDSITVILNQVMMAVPPFFIGIIFTAVFGLALKWFTPGRFIPYKQDPAGFFRYLFFPALAIAIPRSAMSIKLLRNSILNEINKDYVRSADGRGCDDSRKLYVHVLRNALIPVITFLAMVFSAIVAGSIVIEQVFVIPGIGRLLLVSISNRDYPVVLAIITLIAFIVITMNYLSDLLCQVVDPRTRVG